MKLLNIVILSTYAIAAFAAFDGNGPNVKLVAAVSHELFMQQDAAYQESIASDADWFNSTFITNGARQMMWLWTAHTTSFKYAMGSDWDDRWRTGGSGEEVIAEAKIDAESLLAGINKFITDREKRFAVYADACRENATVWAQRS